MKFMYFESTAGLGTCDFAKVMSFLFDYQRAIYNKTLTKSNVDSSINGDYLKVVEPNKELFKTLWYYTFLIRETFRTLSEDVKLFEDTLALKTDQETGLSIKTEKGDIYYLNESNIEYAKNKVQELIGKYDSEATESEEIPPLIKQYMKKKGRAQSPLTEWFYEKHKVKSTMEFLEETFNNYMEKATL